MAALDAAAPGPALVVLAVPVHPATPASTASRAAADSVNLFIGTTAYCGWP
jgi:hypothetical protein